MKLQISNSVNTSIGVSFINVIITLDYGTGTFNSQGIGNPSLRVWASSEAQESGCLNIVLKNENKYIVDAVVQLTKEEIEGGNLPLTIYTKVKEYLKNTYNWTVNIIN